MELQGIKSALQSLLFFSIIFCNSSQAELSAYMQVAGANQGTLVGDVTQAGNEETFEINEMHHLVQNQGGRSSHKPLIVTTPMSKSIPLLFKALDDNEALTITINYYRPNNMGVEENYYTVNLSNAKLVAIEPIMLNNNIPENALQKASVRLRFTYASIIQRYDFGGPDEQIISITNGAALKK